MYILKIVYLIIQQTPSPLLIWMTINVWYWKKYTYICNLDNLFDCQQTNLNGKKKQVSWYTNSEFLFLKRKFPFIENLRIKSLNFVGTTSTFFLWFCPLKVFCTSNQSLCVNGVLKILQPLFVKPQHPVRSKF